MACLIVVEPKRQAQHTVEHFQVTRNTKKYNASHRAGVNKRKKKSAVLLAWQEELFNVLHAHLKGGLPRRMVDTGGGRAVPF